MNLNERILALSQFMSVDEITSYILDQMDFEDTERRNSFVDRYGENVGVCCVDLYAAALHGDSIIPLCFMLSDRMFAIRN